MFLKLLYTPNFFIMLIDQIMDQSPSKLIS